MQILESQLTTQFTLSTDYLNEVVFSKVSSLLNLHHLKWLSQMQILKSQLHTRLLSQISGV